MSRRAKIFSGILAALLAGYLFCLPRDLFKGVPYSTVVTDRSGELLGARTASDGQWRFPPCDSVPAKYAAALIQFEDRHFRWHPGVNPVSIARALRDNVKAGHVTSGGSTITMQVIRMSRRRERNLWQKIVEAVLATRLEMRCSKDEILALYASHAPYGGNVVGLEAASWRYFGRPPQDLSWGEAATLAILPNSPSSIHPGRSADKLLSKRNRLLARLLEHGDLDSLTFSLACDEPLPQEPSPLPSYAYSLTEHYSKVSPGRRIRTSVSLPLQKQVEVITDRWSDDLDRTGVADLSAVVMDVHTGEILSYVGNASLHRRRPGALVDVASSPRSTGSILKPLLYCALLDDGEILPYTLLPDIPINFGGFAPQNFDMQFSGAVPAAEALTRSLNVPSVHMLRRYGVERFLNLLRSLGMTTLGRSADDYGLSLILGGAEGSLKDITGIYASLSKSYQTDTTFFGRTALWYTFDALKELGRPDEIDLRLVRSVRKVAWKTGTSYGFRDAWAVGVTPDYAVGVWAGNAQGGGVPGLTGARTAGPVMFDIFNLLPASSTENAYASGGWFLEPGPKEYVRDETCRQSGHLKGLYCTDTDTLMLPRRALHSDPCPYHREVDGEPRFLLPPSMEWYYRQNHPEYRPLKAKVTSEKIMEFIYPHPGTIIKIPRQLDGSVRGVVFNLAHRDPSVKVWWHLDTSYMGETQYIHQLTLTPAAGRHTITVVDSAGNRESTTFTIEQ